MKKRSKLIASGRPKKTGNHPVNPPVERASTILFPTVEDMRESVKTRDRGTLYYGRRGTATMRAFCEALNALDNGAGCMVFPSGMAAINIALLSQLRSGDHLLMLDSVYDPVRAFCDLALKRLNIETTFYDPCIGKGIADLIGDRTKVVYVEAPGSLTFEMQDIPAIAAATHAAGAAVIMDNTWATPYFFDAFDHGVDISVLSATKYIVGHSDVMLGTVSTTEKYWKQLQRTAHIYGQCASPDDLYLGLRGLRTLELRLQRHWQNAETLIAWLKERDEVERILYPADPDDPGHGIWQRDFSGASGLFGAVLSEANDIAIAAMIDGFEYFGLGFSWGGFESLALPADIHRTATEWDAQGRTLRFHAGLEDAEDLIADLEAGFERFSRALRN